MRSLRALWRPPPRPRPSSLSLVHHMAGRAGLAVGRAGQRGRQGVGGPSQGSVPGVVTSWGQCVGWCRRVCLSSSRPSATRRPLSVYGVSSAEGTRLLFSLLRRLLSLLLAMPVLLLLMLVSASVHLLRVPPTRHLFPLHHSGGGGGGGVQTLPVTPGPGLQSIPLLLLVSASSTCSASHLLVTCFHYTTQGAAKLGCLLVYDS